MSLTDLQGCLDFVSRASPSQIATQLVLDRSLCRSSAPSFLVYALPQKRASSDSIALALAQEKDPRIPLPIARMIYDAHVSSIKAHFASLAESGTEYIHERSSIPLHLVPSPDDCAAALKVLHYLQLPHSPHPLKPSASVDNAVRAIQALVNGQQGSFTAETNRRPKKRLCYICRYTIRPGHAHSLYESLCSPCGAFNLASSALSLPSALDLHGKTALVTGGRVNLGFHTALRLLRCGARVLVSSRYPSDAEHRYLEQEDSTIWRDRLRIIGADFRAAKDVFALVKTVQRQAEEWRGGSGSGPTLHILINNAAQTLTDSVEREAASIRVDEALRAEAELVLNGENYQSKIRGGNEGYLLEAPNSRGPTRLLEGPAPSILVAPTVKSSWTQSISEIPYEDVISAHSVNAFVPFILLRELLPCMASTPSSPGYVVNVSSREGLFETSPNSSSKAGKHVHTNMSKAALNMLTETEAAAAWKTHRVAINSVDPGYMSADPMFMEALGRTDEACPIGWEDGAGRVLWPIARGEGGEPVWGRFLKHFREVVVGR